MFFSKSSQCRDRQRWTFERLLERLSKWPREGVVTTRISVDEWHGGMSEMKFTSLNPVFIVQLEVEWTHSSNDDGATIGGNTREDRKEIAGE